VFRFLAQRVTYANTMATVAVFIALGGVSYAAIKIPSNSVGSKQLKANAVSSSKVRDGSIAVKDLSGSAALALKGPVGPRGPQGLRGESGTKGDKGDAGAPAPGPTWALFNADGTIVEQSGGVSLTLRSASDYFIDMGKTATGHALLATISQKGGGYGAKILASPCGPFSDAQDCHFSIGEAANADGRHVHVFIADGTTLSPQPFYLVLYP
jgi:hypothetical protein